MSSKRMLIDAAHTEETRVVILDGNRIDDFEAETQGKQQLKGNIYIGHVSRVEPSLQAAFITYGGNRNGFLAFGEVHPQFFALKKDEKTQLLEELAEQAARRRGADREDEEEGTETAGAQLADAAPEGAISEDIPVHAQELSPDEISDAEAAAKAAALADAMESGNGNAEAQPQKGRGRRSRPQRAESRARPQRAEAKVERVEKNQPPIHRRYRIQDVLKEGQKILVQVVKEERGSKGAALTTYFSLPGRYTVLMPNTPYAGGISRKITDQSERRQLRDTYAALKVPDTMGLIIRTAGVGQDISHIKHDYENLTNLWQHIISEFEANEDIQCVHEDGSVIIRALRDMMSEEIDEIVISGARAYKMAKDYAKNLMPETAKLIKQHKDETPLFTQTKVEQKLNHLHHTRVTLPSGGYLVINPTEALVSVDINSGRATQERNIEETALKTNLEACDELARQIRLRDLAGLIVVDFIDMEDHRNVRKVENAMRKALRRDRARIQTGNISDFGLMEISRQRLRPSFGESHFIACPHCQGSGLVHSDATSALMVLRRLEEDDISGADRVIVHSSTGLVLWLLNHKRDAIRNLEERYKYQLQFRADDTLTAPDHKLELVRIKADGTESSQLVDVTLREQPELPPEKRQYQSRAERRRDRDDEPHEERGNARPEKKDRDDKRERSDEKRSARSSREENREDKGSRRRGEKHTPQQSDTQDESFSGHKDKGGPRRPRRLGETTAQFAEATEQVSLPEQKRPKGGKPVPTKQAEQTPKKESTAPRPKRESKPVADEPLAVQKIAAETDVESTAIAPAPRRKFEVKKQADTDASDTPLAVSKVSTEGMVEEETRISSKPSGNAKKGVISRLIGR